MKVKYTFHEPGCYICNELVIQGGGISETRYCTGFPKRKNPKRFRASDPKMKAPSWCPRRITPPALRIYGFRDEWSRLMELDNLPQRGQPSPAYISPHSFHYKLRMETTTNLTARQFFKMYHKGRDLAEIDENMAIGEVIEIDNGLRPYFFFCYDYSTIIPVSTFYKPQGEEK